jgi:hypothetical protein
MNQFADLSNDEYKRTYLGLKRAGKSVCSAQSAALATPVFLREYMSVSFIGLLLLMFWTLASWNIPDRLVFLVFSLARYLNSHSNHAVFISPLSLCRTRNAPLCTARILVVGRLRDGHLHRAAGARDCAGRVGLARPRLHCARQGSGTGVVGGGAGQDGLEQHPTGGIVFKHNLFILSTSCNRAF